MNLLYKNSNTFRLKTICLPIVTLLFLILTSSTFGQDQLDNFYYYKGSKVYLEVNKEKVAISFKGENAINTFSSITTSKSQIIEDKSNSSVTPLNKDSENANPEKTYYLELNTTSSTERDYRSLIENYKKLSGVLMISPTYKLNGGELGLSNSFYVKLKKKEDLKLLQLKASEMNLEIVGHDKFMPLWFTLSIPSPRSLNALNYANIFYETGLFESTEPAFMYHNIGLSADPFFPNQWSLNNTGQNGGTAGIDINAEQAWTLTTGNANVVTAVFDHGFEMNHPDLQAVTFGTGFDANNGSTPALVRGSHGTACAGIVGAVQDNNEGISGVAPGARLMSISINLLFSDTPAQLASGFNWAWQNGADVISNSWGGYAPSSIIDNAITNTLTNGRGGLGCVIVFAAGNENNTNIRYPGSSNPDLLVVGAMSPCGERKNPGSCDGETFWGSCFGTQLDVVAPGVLMPTTDRQGGSGYASGNYTQTFNGTSSACPVVAGVAALVLSANPNLTFQEVNDIIESSARKVRTDLYNYANSGGRPNGTWNNQMGYGLVDAYEAVLLAQSTDCPENLSVTQNVPSGSTDVQKASNTLTATNVVSSGGSATYTAGSRVVLNTGFRASNGSQFTAKIEACATRTQRTASDQEDIVYNTKNTDITSDVSDKNSPFEIYPNPTNSSFSVSGGSFDATKDLTITVFNTLGKVQLEQTFSDENRSVDVRALSEGIHFVVITTKDGVSFSRKLVVKR